MVLLHGVLMGGVSWDTVVEGLRDHYRCIIPELPFGAHSAPMPDGADLSLLAIATLVAQLLRWRWIGPPLHDPKIRRDLTKYLTSVPKPQQLLE